ncbi:A/G-specific adenine glycosylase [soil metagenome]
MSEPSLAGSEGVAAALHTPILSWYAENARDLPWRDRAASPWSILVSEVMLQQTPVARVEPIWRSWMHRWPTPRALAQESGGEAVRAWGRLGYPRRAIRLHACATTISAAHGGEVPREMAELLALPGVGEYTAGAVAAFAFGQRTVVVDTNVRRVLARAVTGRALPAASLTRDETALARAALPHAETDSVRWNVAVMELGALVCTARTPACQRCPVQDRCAWVSAGSPAYDGPPRRGQAWEGTDRQCRGTLLHLLREHDGWLPRDAFDAAWPQDPVQLQQCLDALVTEGLIQRSTDPAPDVSHDSAPPVANSEGAEWYGFAAG